MAARTPSTNKKKRNPTKRERGLTTADEGESKSKQAAKKTMAARKKKDTTVEATLATVADENDGRTTSNQMRPNEQDLPVLGARPSVTKLSKAKTPLKPGGTKVEALTDEQKQWLAHYRQLDSLPCLSNFLQRALMRDKPVETLIIEFKAHSRVLDINKMTAFKLNPARNRYKDVGCLDNNRVVLQLGDQPYCHANYVGPAHDPRKFICCQAPLDSTLADFWHMVVQDGCRCIVMLCNYLEKRVPKCAHYLPPAPGVPTIFGLVTVTIIRTEAFVYKDAIRANINRTILDVSWESGASAQSPCSSSSNNTARGTRHLQVEHLHWMNWPDRGVPPADETPLELVRHVQQHVGSPIVVHCSAGIGRTGCFVMLDILLGLFDRRIPWPADLHTILDEIRRSRFNSIQNEQQYLYVHQVLLNFLKKECLLTPEMVKAHFAWTFSYDRACEAFK